MGSEGDPPPLQSQDGCRHWEGTEKCKGTNMGQWKLSTIILLLAPFTPAPGKVSDLHPLPTTRAGKWTWVHVHSLSRTLGPTWPKPRRPPKSSWHLQSEIGLYSPLPWLYPSNLASRIGTKNCLEAMCSEEENI